MYCAACYPNKISSHRGTYFATMLDLAFGLFTSYKAQPQLPLMPRWFSPVHWFYLGMKMLGVVSFSKEFNRKDHYPRSWVIIDEALRRGIPIESVRILKRVSSYYRVRFGNKMFYYDSVPSRFLHLHLDNKEYVKAELLRKAFPAPKGHVFWSQMNAVRYGLGLGFPLAVKPASGTHAYHVTAPVANEEELTRAVALAKQYGPRFIVERFCTGELYRVTAINMAHVFVARREAPNVVGDGTHSIRELIEIKNSDPRRGDQGQKDTTLHKIPLSGTTDKALERARFTYASVPKKDEKILLHYKASIGSGGDIIEETALLHPENREMFRRAAGLFGVDLVGFDVIADDLSHPYTEQACGIIEANSIPMIDFHHNPELGEARDVAGRLWDEIVADERVRYVFPVLDPRRSFLRRAFWHFLDLTMPMIQAVLLWLHYIATPTGRQEFSVGNMRQGIAPEAAIAHLKLNGFEVVRPAWRDRGEVTGLRKLLDHERQCHVRFYNDGEVRAHVEYAPEARPFAHLLEQGFQAAHEVVHGFLHQFLDWRARP